MIGFWRNLLGSGRSSVRRRSLRLFTHGFVFPVAALANHGNAEIGVGGLIFKKSEDVRMNSEDLILSPELVSVEYEFENLSSKEVGLIIAFPLPALYAAPDPEAAATARTDSRPSRTSRPGWMERRSGRSARPAPSPATGARSPTSCPDSTSVFFQAVRSKAISNHCHSKGSNLFSCDCSDKSGRAVAGSQLVLADPIFLAAEVRTANADSCCASTQAIYGRFRRRRAFAGRKIRIERNLPTGALWRRRGWRAVGRAGRRELFLPHRHLYPDHRSTLGAVHREVLAERERRAVQLRQVRRCGRDFYWRVQKGGKILPACA